ncbi:MAG: hypothetical protein VX498_07315 [Myxococcota bacterium]|nr:hypothetical protein [Myxococcota bacterium]
MTLRSRNSALLLLCVVGFIVLRVFSPKPPVSPWTWDWRSVTQGPTGDLAVVGTLDFSPVRLVGSPDELAVRTTAELLWSAGLLGVRVGPPATHPDSVREIWVVPSDSGCRYERESLEHLERGGGLVTWNACPAVLARLGLGSPSALQGPPPYTGFVGGVDGDLPLPVPGAGAEWPEQQPGWTSLVRGSRGGSLVLRSGRNSVFSIDLSGWLRDLRQGDASLSGMDRDGIHGPKPNDLRPFPWASPLWRTPGAELWTEVLIGELQAGALQVGPALPRLWALPSAAPSALILTSDQDFGEPTWIESILVRVEDRGGEMSVMSTAWTRQTNSAPVDASGGSFLAGSALSRARAWGHGIGLHPNGAGLGAPSSVVESIRLADRLGRVNEGDSLRVVRNHYLLWWDYEEPMQLYADLNYWMELNFVSIEPRFRGPGFLFGSARPARFVGSRSILPVLSQPTQIEDDVLTSDFPYSPGLSSEEAVLASGRLLDTAVLHRIPLTANLHPMWVVADGGTLLDGLLDQAVDRGVPIVSAERWATQSWNRLRWVLGTGLQPSGEEWSYTLPPEVDRSVPQWLWKPGTSACSDPTRASALGDSGCLMAWPPEQ